MTQELVMGQREDAKPGSRWAAATGVTHLSLRQVLVRSHEKGGEERLRRPQIREEAIGAEEEGRVDRLHAQVAQHDLQLRVHAAAYHRQPELRHAASSAGATQVGFDNRVLASAARRLKHDSEAVGRKRRLY